MGMRTLNRKTLEDDPFLRPFFGGDNEDEGADERPKPGDRRRDRNSSRKKNEDEDDEDEDDFKDIEDPKDRRIAELSQEAGRRRREKNAERKQREELERRLEELANKDKSAEEQAAAKMKQLEDDNSVLKARLEKAIVRAAIVNDDDYKWHDADEVFSKLELMDLEIDPETGTVDGLKEQLKSIAKKKPYLLKEGPSKKDDKEGAQIGSTGHNPRGSGARSTGTRTTNATRREELAKKYKSLGESIPL